MEWFYQMPGVETLDSAESFFRFFSVPYETQELQACNLTVLSEFHRRLRAAVPLRNSLELAPDADWQLARRLLAESYQNKQPGAPS
ncbi:MULTISPECIES: nitrogenase-stabilizing/protective protein NifW [Symbiopectobacterium]|uniref:nitrogenase-stabilizing/protective protein NifW n=1 Tax=Symbiopectobacterium TaxID=801 RepID=UPI001A20584B|nr:MULTISPECIES: nitrogenase-stabilizing/protective protein NifW [Symbiopectobacterium]MBG6248441.1 nitrogen fixation protein NifW [Candidatus Symbiopectobacterium sp. PLON1]MBT9429817.1 nitrogen fixation protein NifW [Candidatus Symbiopectobacterium endolongispinus]